MNRTQILASGTAAIALGLTAWALIGPESGENPKNPVAGEDASRYSDRPASKIQPSRDSSRASAPSGTAKLSERPVVSTTGENDANQTLNRLLTPAQLAGMAAARQRAAEQAKSIYSNPSFTTRVAQLKPSQSNAVAQIREDLRTAVKTDPDGWIDTYESLNRDFAKQSGSYSGRGSGLPGDAPAPAEPIEPSIPEPSTPEPSQPVEPSDPVEEVIELPIPLDEAQRLAEEIRVKKRNSLDPLTEREDRFQKIKE